MRLINTEKRAGKITLLDQSLHFWPSSLTRLLLIEQMATLVKQIMLIQDFYETVQKRRYFLDEAEVSKNFLFDFLCQKGLSVTWEQNRSFTIISYKLYTMIGYEKENTI